MEVSVQMAAALLKEGRFPLVIYKRFMIHDFIAHCFYERSECFANEVSAFKDRAKRTKDRAIDT